MTEVTILTFRSDSHPIEFEAFTLWHGGEHRVNDLVVEWGDVDNWVVDIEKHHVVASNASLGAEITLRLLSIQTGGEGTHGAGILPPTGL